jgi:hypothetical protein
MRTTFVVALAATLADALKLTTLVEKSATELADTCVADLNKIMSPEAMAADTTGTIVKFVQDFCVDRIDFFPSKSPLK